MELSNIVYLVMKHRERSTNKPSLLYLNILDIKLINPYVQYLQRIFFILINFDGIKKSAIPKSVEYNVIKCDQKL